MQSVPNSGPQTPQCDFYSSPNSPLGKVRRWTWISAAIALVVAVASTKGSGNLLFVGGFLLSLFLAIDVFFRRQLRFGQPVISLSGRGIESLLFTGKLKSYAWSEIGAVRIETVQGIPRILLQLSGSTGKRRVWLQMGEAHPTIPLNTLAPDDQRRAIEAMGAFAERSHVDGGTAFAGVVDAAAEEQAFHAELAAFAPTPWITYAIIMVNVAIWIFTLMVGGGIQSTTAERLLDWGGNAASEVQKGEWWRMVTATFLHSGVLHVAMNMVGLASAGVTVERIYGARQYLLIYFGSALVGSALSLHFSAQHAVSVGASGAVFGVTGALLVAVLQHRDRLPGTFSSQTLSGIGFFVVYSLLQGFGRSGIDNAAHVGGLIGGCALAFLLPERFDMQRFIATERQRFLAGTGMAIAMIVGISVAAPHAAVDQRQVFQGNAAFGRGMDRFSAAIKEMQRDEEAAKAGKMTEREIDDRSRSVYAPKFREVVQDLSAAYIPATDPRLPLLTEMRRFSALILESLEMQSVIVEGSDKPQPSDPERFSALQAEAAASGKRVEQLIKNLGTVQRQR